MAAFTVSNAQVENFDGYSMVIFDLETARGSVELAEYVEVDADGDVVSVERTESNIQCHMGDEVCSVFDMSEKPGLMPWEAYVPMDEIIDSVEGLLQ